MIRLALALSIAATPALACVPPRQQIVDLARDYGEQTVASGISDADDNRGDIALMTLNPATGTWTIVQISLGCAYIIAFGSGGEINRQAYLPISKGVTQ